MRRILLASLLFANATPIFAAKDDADPKQFLDKSIVVIPQHVGDYTLGETHYEPQAWMYGVTSKWVINAAPEALRYTLFVYPIGLTPEERAVTQQSDEVERSLQEATKQGTYTDLVVGERVPFVVVAPEPSLHTKAEEGSGKGRRGKPEEPAPFDPRPKPEPVVEALEDDDPFAATAAATRPSPNSHGQRQSFRFTHDGVPMRSLGYVFYRHLFAFKVRVTAPLDSMDDATFDALADTATRYLVPQIDVRNYGQCGNISIAMPPATSRKQKKADSERFAKHLLYGYARVKAANCTASDAPATPDAPPRAAQIEIVYPEGIWKAGD